MQQRRTGVKPDAAFLRDVATRHLARFATTEHGLTEVLNRRVTRWLRQSVSEGEETLDPGQVVAELAPTIREIVQEMVSCGALNDRVYSVSRARNLLRTGHSRRHVSMWLQDRGVSKDLIGHGIEEAIGVDETAAEREFGAALVFARKKRVGPFAEAAQDLPADARMKARQQALARFARAGFTQEMANRVLQATLEEAHEAIYKLRDL